jgi:hypothetical protein
MIELFWEAYRGHASCDGPLSTGRYSRASDIRSVAVAEFTSREMHLIKRVLATSTLAVERVTEGLHSDDENMKSLLVKLVKSDVELAMYVRKARNALTGESERAQALSATRRTG